MAYNYNGVDVPYQQYGREGNAAQWAIQAFQNYFGRTPTQDELAQAVPLFAGGDKNISDTGAGNQYVAALHQQQVAKDTAPQEEAKAIQDQYPIVQDLINKQVQGQIQNFTDPNSEAYKTFSGNFNNLGITPSSGAFQSGLGSKLGQFSADALSAGLGAVGLPIAQTYSQGATQPFQDTMGTPQTLRDRGYQTQDFYTMMDQMNRQKQGSGMWGDIIGGGLQGAVAGGSKGGPWGALAGAGAGAGGGYAKSRDTWICTELFKQGLISSEDIEKIHAHLYRAKWKRPLQFLGYFLFGRLLVSLANKVGTSWNVWKPEFYDQVMREPDPVKAVDLYAESFWSLYSNVKRRLTKQEEVYGS